MCSHSLKVNNAKSEFMLFGSRAHLLKSDVRSMKVGDSVITVSNKCKNLGVTFDSVMSMSSQVSRICQSVQYQMRNLGFIRKYLTKSSTEKIVHALITSRLDFCNALLYNISQSQLERLQKLQNNAARIVSLSPKRKHITPVLFSLHWLPVKYRIIFKLLLLVFHSLHGTAPHYNCNIIIPYNPSRNLRSSGSFFLAIPQTHNSWGDRSFQYAGPSLWNKLPLDIRSISSLSHFKTSLKTWLFQQAFA